MDGLSGAASVMAVISLAVQLGDSAFKIYKFLETVKDAPNEVVGLKERVLQLHKLLKGVQDLVKRQNAQGNLPPPPEYLLDALQTCKLKMRSLEDYTEKLHSNADRRGLRRVWGALKIPYNKELIAKASLQIQDAVQALHLAISINNGMITLVREDCTEIVVSCVEGKQPAASIASTCTGSIDSGALQGIRKKVSRQTVSNYRTPLGVYTSRTVWIQPLLDGFDDDSTTDENPLNYRTTMTFAPTFSSRILIWQTRSLYGHVERNFRTYNICPELFNSILRSLSSVDEDERPRELQRQLSKGLNPFILDEGGFSLLERFVCRDDGGVTRLLLQIGVGIVPTHEGFGDIVLLNNQRITVGATLALGRGQGRIREKTIWPNHVLKTFQDSAEQLFGFELRSSLFSWGIFQLNDSVAPNFLSIMSRCQDMSIAASMEHWDTDVRYGAAAFLMDILHTHEPLRQDSIIEAGWWIFTTTVYSYETENAFSVWLRDVQRRGLNVQRVREELLTVLKNEWLEDDLRPGFRNRLLIIDSGTARWEWQHAESEEAFELCQEFEDLLLHDVAMRGLLRHKFADSWPYHFPWPRSFYRVPRRFRRQVARERTAAQQMSSSRGSLMPGTFPEDLYHQDLCNIHCQSLPCLVCKWGEWYTLFLKDVDEA